jgi:putative ABC transport system ATP-binding protein
MRCFHSHRIERIMFVLEGIERRYGDTVALRIDRWEAHAGERWLIAGPSGSGKSTALALLTGLLRPTAGTIVVSGQNLAALEGAALDRWRGRAIGFVPQRLHLVDSLSVLDNVLLAQYLAGNRPDVHRARATLTSVGLEALLDRRPSTLSQGQAQRVAVARAVVNGPALLIADEPTASLDDEHAARTLDLLIAQAESSNATLVVASHDGRIRHAFAHRLNLPNDNVQ